MKISARLKLVSVAPLLMALLIGLSLLYSYNKMEEAREKGNSAHLIMKSVTELNDFARTYMLYHEERPRRQFLLAHDEVSELIDSISFTEEEPQRLLQNIRRNSESMRDTFLGLVSSHTRDRSGGNDTLLREAEERLAGQLLIRLRDVFSDSIHLEDLMDKEIAFTQGNINSLVVVLIIGTALSLTVVLAGMIRSINRSLAKLRKGTEIIGAGNLDHRIGMAEEDEMGDLSRAFDRMAEKLQAVTVSKNELLREIEERKRAEKEVLRLNEELKQHAINLEASNKELEAFSYSVSHDLRTPLRSIDGFSKIILEDNSERLNENGKDALLRIRSASQRMGVLIDGLLNLTRISRSEIVRNRVNVSAIARGIEEELKRSQPERDVEFIIDDELVADSDEHLLHIVLQNLLGNAWKFTEKHEKARIHLGSMEYEGKTAYFVSDDGAGFNMDYVNTLFSPFSRLHSEDEFSGTGIGLATVQKVIQRHGGHIWAESGVEKGATFYFTLS